jgi:hypothetical protein
MASPVANSLDAPVILPGSLVTVSDATSIYRGYKGIVQRLSGDRAAVLFEGGCWDKLVTLPLRALALS